MPKVSKNTKRYRGQAKMFYWEKELKDPFEVLIGKYDPFLSTNNAIKKLVQWAIKEQWIPGYERRDKEELVMNKDAAGLDLLRPDKTIIKP